MSFRFFLLFGSSASYPRIIFRKQVDFESAINNHLTHLQACQKHFWEDTHFWLLLKACFRNPLPGWFAGNPSNRTLERRWPSWLSNPWGLTGPWILGIPLVRGPWSNGTPWTIRCENQHMKTDIFHFQTKPYTAGYTIHISLCPSMSMYIPYVVVTLRQSNMACWKIHHLVWYVPSYKARSRSRGFSS